MSNLNQFLGVTPKAIFNAFSSNGATPISLATNADDIVTLSGALTANTLKTVLSITGGGGVLRRLGMQTVDATARTLRMKITLDGTVVFDATSASINSGSYGIAAIGGFSGVSGYSADADQVPFAASCLVEIASSLTETDKVKTYYLYRTN